MGRFVKGNVVVVPFPFSDLSGSKRRPALVLADLDGDDILLCQITSNARTDRYAILLTQHDFVSGGLSVSSVIRPNKVFTADKRMIVYIAGELSADKMREVLTVFATILAE
jgi:mRNA interferase MazF